MSGGSPAGQALSAWPGSPAVGPFPASKFGDLRASRPEPAPHPLHTPWAPWPTRDLAARLSGGLAPSRRRMGAPCPTADAPIHRGSPVWSSFRTPPQDCYAALLAVALDGIGGRAQPPRSSSSGSCANTPAPWPRRNPQEQIEVIPAASPFKNSTYLSSGRRCRARARGLGRRTASRLNTSPHLTLSQSCFLPSAQEVLGTCAGCQAGVGTGPGALG